MLNNVANISHENHRVDVIKDSTDVVGISGRGEVEEALTLDPIPIGEAVL